MKIKLISLYSDPLYRNSLSLMLNSASGALFGLIFWIVAARTMPTKDIGLATAAISAALLIVGLSRLGLETGLIRYLPESNNKKGLYNAIVMVTLVLALVLTAVLMLGINIFSPSLSFLRDGWFLPVFFAYIAITSINSVQNMAFVSIRRADLSLIQNLLLGARIPILLLISGLGVFGIFSSFGSAYLMTYIFGVFVLRRYWLSLTTGFDIDSIRKTLKFSPGNYTTDIFAMEAARTPYPQGEAWDSSEVRAFDQKRRDINCMDLNYMNSITEETVNEFWNYAGIQRGKYGC